ncbi:MAG: NAD-dependent epimerase/dehydratase family protein [Bacteroidota bacterium]
MILVTGGTGLVGAHLLYSLLQKHSKVRATHRSSSDLDNVKKVFSFYAEEARSLFDRIEWVETNITEIPALTLAFEGVTKVYHCAAFISFNPKHYYILKKTNVEGTANVVNLCLTHGIQKLCYVSSIATLGNTLDQSPVDEETDWNPEDDHSVYSITKFGAEMEVWRGVQEGLTAVIVNPGVILGAWFRNSGSGRIIKNAAKGNRFYTTGSTGFVDVRDVVKVMTLLMEGPYAQERYIVVGENMNYGDFLSRMARLFNKKPPSKAIGKGVLLLLSKLDALSSFLFRSKRKLLKSMVMSMYHTTHYDSSKVKAELNFEFTPMEETLARIVNSYSSSSS